MAMLVSGRVFSAAFQGGFLCILSQFFFHPFFLIEAIEDMDDGFRLKVLRTMEERKKHLG